MSRITFSEDELVDAISTISTTSSETSDPVCPLTTSSRPASPIAQPCHDINLISQATPPVEHSKYYVADTIPVQVKDLLYSVPRWISQQSLVLKQRILGDGPPNTFLLEEISVIEMDAFLDVCDARVAAGVSHFTFEQWTGALAVADQLEVPFMLDYLVQRVDEGTEVLDPFDCIDMALRYRKREWLVRAFLRICKQPRPLSLQEAIRIGVERTNAIGRIRERISVYEAQQQMAWVRREWPTEVRAKGSSKGYKTIVLQQPDWSSMSETVKAAVSTELGRLVDLEAVFSESEALPSLNNARVTFSTTSTAKPHPRHSHSDLCILKLRDTLYRVPVRYFELPGLLRAVCGTNSWASREPFGELVLPDDLEISEWDIFLDILTARPFADPLLTLPFSSWMAGLRVAARFHQHSVCDYILRRLQDNFPDQEPVDLLEAAKIAQAAPSAWLQHNYERLARRRTPPSIHEIRRIGEVAIAKACMLRWSS